MVAHIDVNGQKGPCGRHQQAKPRSLPKILSERTEKVSGYNAVLPAGHIDQNVEKGGGGGTDGEDGQTADQPQDIGDKQIENPVHAVPERIVQIEKFVHDRCPPWISV